jgi:energy-coupling factor transport system substrate-specific component
MGFLNSLSFDIGIPGTEVTVRPHYGLLTFFGVAFGPVAGFIVGFFGNMIGDYLAYGDALESWHWSVANGLVGLVAGLVPFLMASRLTSVTRRAAVAAVAGFAGVVVGMLFIFIELRIQPQLGFEYILTQEYIPTVIANSIAAIVVTPILVLAWDPLAEQLHT